MSARRRWPQVRLDMAPDRHVELADRAFRRCGGCGRSVVLLDDGCTFGFRVTCPLCGHRHPVPEPVVWPGPHEWQVTVDRSFLGRWLWQVVCVCGMDGGELPSRALARAAGERHAAGKERATTRRAA